MFFVPYGQELMQLLCIFFTLFAFILLSPPSLSFPSFLFCLAELALYHSFLRSVRERMSDMALSGCVHPPPLPYSSSLLSLQLSPFTRRKRWELFSFSFSLHVLHIPAAKMRNDILIFKNRKISRLLFVDKTTGLYNNIPYRPSHYQRVIIYLQSQRK